MTRNKSTPEPEDTMSNENANDSLITEFHNQSLVTLCNITVDNLLDQNQYHSLPSSPTTAQRTPQRPSQITRQPPHRQIVPPSPSAPGNTQQCPLYPNCPEILPACVPSLVGYRNGQLTLAEARSRPNSHGEIPILCNLMEHLREKHVEKVSGKRGSKGICLLHNHENQWTGNWNNVPGHLESKHCKNDHYRLPCGNTFQSRYALYSAMKRPCRLEFKIPNHTHNLDQGQTSRLQSPGQRAKKRRH